MNLNHFTYCYHIASQHSYGDREKNLHQNGGVRIFQGSHRKRERIYQGHIYIINVKLTIRSKYELDLKCDG